KPLERKYGVNALSHVGISKFWDKYTQTIRAGNRYHMSKPEHILALYLAIIYGRVVSKDYKGAFANQAAFSYININNERSIEVEKRTDRFGAMQQYFQIRDD